MGMYVSRYNCLEDRVVQYILLLLLLLLHYSCQSGEEDEAPQHCPGQCQTTGRNVSSTHYIILPLEGWEEHWGIIM